MLSLVLFVSLNLTAAQNSIQGLDLTSGKSTTITLSKSQKYQVVVFLSSKCPCSKSHEPKLKELAKTYTADGFQFVAIHSNADEDLKSARQYFSESQLGFPVISDPQSKIADRFNALKTPHVFVTDQKGKILYQGGVDDSSDSAQAEKNYLASALADLKAGKTVALAETRTLGCRIERP